MTQPRTGLLGRAIEWAFRDRNTGRITVGQWPNLSLWLFIVLFALPRVAEAVASPVADWARIASDFALAWWACDEVVRGVNPWRRFLGAIALAGLAAMLTLRSIA